MIVHCLILCPNAGSLRIVGVLDNFIFYLSEDLLLIVAALLTYLRPDRDQIVVFLPSELQEQSKYKFSFGIPFFENLANSVILHPKMIHHNPPRFTDN